MTPRRTLVLGTRALLVGGLTLAGAATAVPAQASRPFDPARQTSISLRVYTEQVRPIGTAGGVRVSGDGFGSAVAPVPGHKNQVYGLTDRGPNVDGPTTARSSRSRLHARRSGGSR